MQGMPVFLTGFMGVGKSKIGGILACRLGRDFLDTDQMIEERAGMEISAIFASAGEAHFRQLEHACLEQACARKNAVISLGGGAIAQQGNLELVRCAGVLICLEADLDTIVERVSRRDDRPLLSGLKAEEKWVKIKTMLDERAPYYNQAHIKMLSSEGLAPEETAEKLIELLEYWSEERRRTNE
ncbi:MAG: shikimate kinase [Candidatus Latescibacterota bacterium]|jgi:shikimate kinase|tara:strand:- start:600 stop:1151 length:552 start_codon:yes stop_codon:yes gene_type:complete